MAALVVSFKEHEDEVADEAAAEADTSKVATELTAQVLLAPESGAGPGPQLPARPAAGPRRRIILAVGGGRGHRDEAPSPQRL